MAEPSGQFRPRSAVLLRDLILFQIKLALDGLKDLILSPASLAAGALDILLGPNASGHRLYRVLRAGERFDRWLNLFGAAEGAETSEEGLFGASRAGDDSFLGRMEQWSGGEREGRKPPPTDPDERGGSRR